MQGYLLVNDRGERINQAPTNIVFNKGGSRAEIRNGLSCMSCHANGMRTLTDDVRAATLRSAGVSAGRCRTLVSGEFRSSELLAEDQARFEAALRKTGVQPGAEPITELSERYATSLDASAAAHELGLTRDEFLRRLKQSESLRQLGLATLLAGGTVKRDAWEDVFGDVIDEFQTGVWISPTQVYGERFFTGSSVPTRRSAPLRLSNQSERIPSILNALVGRPVRTIEGGRERTYSIKDVRSPDPCSIEIQDVTRLNDPGNTSQWWSEEDIQSFSLRAVRASLAPEGTVSGLLSGQIQQRFDSIGPF